MREAREDMDVDDAELLGMKKKKAAAATGATAAEGQAGTEGASTSGRNLVR